MKKALLGAGVLAMASPLAVTGAAATETITYAYDALGRLVAVQSSGTVNNGQAVTTRLMLRATALTTPFQV